MTYRWQVKTFDKKRSRWDVMCLYPEKRNNGDSFKNLAIEHVKNEINNGEQSILIDLLTRDQVFPNVAKGDA